MALQVINYTNPLSGIASTEPSVQLYTKDAVDELIADLQTQLGNGFHAPDPDVTALLGRISTLEQDGDQLAQDVIDLTKRVTDLDSMDPATPGRVKVLEDGLAAEITRATDAEAQERTDRDNAIETHNTSPDAHEDIRQNIADIETDIDQLQLTQIKSVDGEFARPDNDIYLGVGNKQPVKAGLQIYSAQVQANHVHKLWFTSGAGGAAYLPPNQPSGITFDLGSSDGISRRGSLVFTTVGCSWQEYLPGTTTVDPASIVYFTAGGTWQASVNAPNPAKSVQYYNAYGDTSYLQSVATANITANIIDFLAVNDVNADLQAHKIDMSLHSTPQQRAAWDQNIIDTANHIANVTDAHNMDSRLALKTNQTDFVAHVNDEDRHVDASEQSLWNNTAANAAAHIANSGIHVTDTNKADWDGVVASFGSHVQDVEATNTAPHVTIADRTNWNDKADLTALEAEASARALADTAINNRIDSMQNLGRFLGNFDTYADMIAALGTYDQLPPEASINDYVIIATDENKAGQTSQYKLTAIGTSASPSNTWTYAVKLDENINGKVDKVPTAVAGNLPTFVNGGNLQDSGTALVNLATNASVTAAVAAETSRAQGVESSLDARIVVNTGAIAANGTAIQGEITRATGAESTLDGKITVNANNLANEITRATGAESTLDGKITAETTRAQSAETALKNLIDELRKTGHLVGTYAQITNLPAVSPVGETQINPGDYAYVQVNPDYVPALYRCATKDSLNNITWTLLYEMNIAISSVFIDLPLETPQWTSGSARLEIYGKQVTFRMFEAHPNTNGADYAWNKVCTIPAQYMPPNMPSYMAADCLIVRNSGTPAGRFDIYKSSCKIETDGSVYIASEYYVNNFRFSCQITWVMV